MTCAVEDALEAWQVAQRIKPRINGKPVTPCPRPHMQQLEMRVSLEGWLPALGPQARRSRCQVVQAELERCRARNSRPATRGELDGPHARLPPGTFLRRTTRPHQRTHTGAKRSDADAAATCSASAAERMRRTFGIWTADCVNEIGSGTVPYQQTLLPKAQSERVECGY